MFTKTELEVMAKLLDLAADQFSNHGCNDFELPATAENIALVRQVEEDEPSVRGDTVDTLDWCLMYFLKNRCLEERDKLS